MSFSSFLLLFQQRSSSFCIFLPGDPGFTGLRGDIGDSGLKGDRGDKGLPGPPGNLSKVEMEHLKGQKGDIGVPGMNQHAGYF